MSIYTMYEKETEAVKAIFSGIILRSTPTQTGGRPSTVCLYVVYTVRAKLQTRHTMNEREMGEHIFFLEEGERLLF